MDKGTDALTHSLIKDVWEHIGPGFSECVYHRALECAFRRENLSYVSERVLPIEYKGEYVGTVRLDMTLRNDTIIELKSVTKLNKDHRTQLQNYLRLTGMSRGILVNFGDTLTIEDVKPLQSLQL